MSTAIDKDNYLTIARATGVFKPEEMLVLDELLDACRSAQETSYVLIEEHCDAVLAGFMIFGRAPMTAFSWDMYWIVVDASFQRRCIGKKLLERLENRVLTGHSQAIIRAETSSKREYASARNFYTKNNFVQAGSITNFYDTGDDLLVFCKYISAGARN